MIEILVWAFLGGIVGAVFMDATESYASKVGITSGVNVALIGRWFLSLMRGQFAHANILESKPMENEVIAGWVFHFIVGGGGVALLYPLFFIVASFGIPNHFVLGGLLFGLITSLLPWFVLLPSFGWGLFGRHGPRGSNPLLASTISHIPYGLGVSTVIWAGLQIQ